MILGIQVVFEFHENITTSWSISMEKQASRNLIGTTLNLQLNLEKIDIDILKVSALPNHEHDITIYLFWHL